MNPSDYYKITLDVFKEKESAFLDYLKKLVGREIKDQEIKDAIINSNFNFARCLIEHDYEAGELAYRLLVKHYMQLNLNDLSFEIEGDGQYKITRTSDFNYPTYRKKVDEVEKWQHVFEIAKKS
ncbi:MAG: hypothetical protein E7Y34_02475, partial [Mycoplasma sp.]|nr:hypothetical protein [Mycoplasma sp.]